MAEIIPMPKLGFDMSEGTLSRWVKKEGEKVERGEVLAEIETDKATVEVESNFGGVLYKQLVPEGTVAAVGIPIAVISQPGEEVKEIPQIVIEGGVAKESVGGGAAQPPAEEKAVSQPTPAPAAAAQAPVEEQAAETAKTGPAEQPAVAEGPVRASPLARSLARERGIDLQRLRGTGPGGRIVRRDVETAAAVPAPAAAAAQPNAPAPAPVPAPAATGAPAFIPAVRLGEVPPDEHIPLPRLRAAIGRRMVQSWQQSPHFFETREYDVGDLTDVRQRINKDLPDEQKVSVNDFIVKAVALALRRFSNLNASIQGDEIVRFGHINVGVAVAIENGLMTVVIKDADQKPLLLISQESKERIARARSGKVQSEDVEGSTFSISNLGMYGITEFLAVINPPEAAILAIGAARQVPVVVDGQIQVGMRMNATISADHRVTDGAEAAQFMQVLAEYLEHPMRLLVS